MEIYHINHHSLIFATLDMLKHVNSDNRANSAQFQLKLPTGAELGKNLQISASSTKKITGSMYNITPKALSKGLIQIYTKI